MGVRVMATLEGAIRESSGGGYMGNALSGTIRTCAFTVFTLIV